MKHLTKRLLKIKTRYYAAVLLVSASVAATPAAVRSAHAFRGYKAVGGKYLLIPLGLILA